MTYNMKCEAGHKFEVFVKDKKDIKQFEKCSVCGKKAKIVPGAPGFNFKGGNPTPKFHK